MKRANSSQKTYSSKDSLLQTKEKDFHMTGKESDLFKIFGVKFSLKVSRIAKKRICRAKWQKRQFLGVFFAWHVENHADRFRNTFHHHFTPPYVHVYSRVREIRKCSTCTTRLKPDCSQTTLQAQCPKCLDSERCSVAKWRTKHRGSLRLCDVHSVFDHTSLSVPPDTYPFTYGPLSIFNCPILPC